MPSKETLALVADLITRLGIPTVVAGVLLWFALHYVHDMMELARATQLEMQDLLVHCCPVVPRP